MNKKYFILTSNVDGFFRRIFDEQHVCEMHGTCDEWQCSARCTNAIFQLPENFRFELDENL